MSARRDPAPRLRFDPAEASRDVAAREQAEGKTPRKTPQLRGNPEIKRKARLISADTKRRVIEDHKRGEMDTGSTEIQVALLTERLTELSEHFKVHKKDHHSRRGLFKIVSRRRRLLDYLAENDYARYQALIERLELRR